jgi:hypothetical protein
MTCGVLVVCVQHDATALALLLLPVLWRIRQGTARSLPGQQLSQLDSHSAAGQSDQALPWTC